MWTERLSTATLSSFCLYKIVTAIPLCKRNGNLTPPTGCYIRMLIHSCYELFPKSILPFLKKLTTFWKRGRIIWKCSCLNSPLKQCLNAVLIAFKRCFKRHNFSQEYRFYSSIVAFFQLLYEHVYIDTFRMSSAIPFFLKSY